MRIAWFSPLSRASAIGRFSVDVAQCLSRVADVDLCHFESRDVRDTQVRTRYFESADLVPRSVLDGYDVLVYNFGNYLPFHREIFRLARSHHGICILHDFVMHHFIANYYLDYERDHDAYRAVLNRAYGAEAPLPHQRVWESTEVVKYPLFEEIARYALGVITHSEFFRKRVEKVFAGPVCRIPLAYTAKPVTREQSRSKLGLDSDRTVMLTVGHVNPNKQVDWVFEALARTGQRRHPVRYYVVGAVALDYRRKLEALVRKYRLEEETRILGQVTDVDLGTYLAAADICVNLRFPAMEGASASAIEEMLCAKPVLVTDTGFFSELPDDCVVKVPPGNEAAIDNALIRLINDVEFREALGNRAKTFAESEFSPASYATRALDFIAEVRTARPILELSDRIAAELNTMGVHADMSIVDRLANAITDTFAGKGSG